MISSPTWPLKALLARADIGHEGLLIIDDGLLKSITPDNIMLLLLLSLAELK